MAWQLIYTSAPRSLEAGRSGFGTVARHRAISPLLVSAIERTSQFSRLPGTDAGRVIFCHRIIAVAGGRFHVLSAIRDAGADYTGRTNHIAHHLIVDPREIAQLGPDGPSPADVLLAMRWATSWNEPPRFLEASDEIALSAIHPQTNGSAWEQITGSANQAGLLATGDASRGAYIIQPESTDLRAVYAESLRLIPERLWQITFTTSLQPSDEPADFRWIGIEERSPLRIQSESSGRPVLNLAAPHTLPVSEKVEPAAVKPRRDVPASVTTPAWPETWAASLGTSSEASDTSPFATNERSTEARSVSTAPGPRIRLKWWLLTGVVGAVTLIGALVFSFFVKSYLQKQKARNAMAEGFGATGYFSNDTSRQLADALVTSADDSRCKELARASNALIQTLRSGDLAKLMSKQTNENLKTLEDTNGLLLPDELRALRKTVIDLQGLSTEPFGFKQADDAKALSRLMNGRRDEISKWDSPKFPISLKLLINELRANADRQQADGLLRMAKQRMGPQEGTLFREIVRDFGKPVTDPIAQTKIKQIEEFLNTPVPKQVSTPKPDMVNPATKAPNVTAAIPQKKRDSFPQVPLYFFNGEAVPLAIKLPVPASSLSFSVDEGNAPAYILDNSNNSGNLRRGAAESIFKLGHLERGAFEPGTPFDTIELEKNSLKLPFRLLAHDGNKTEVFEFCFVRQNFTQPFLPNTAGGLQIDGAAIFLDPALIPLPGTPHETLYLKTPDSFSPEGKGAIYPLKNFRLEISSIVGLIKKQQKSYLDKKDGIKLPTIDSLFEENVVLAKSQLSNEGQKGYSDKGLNNHVQSCGGMLAEYGHDLGVLGLGSVSKLPGSDMVNRGKELIEAYRELEKKKNQPDRGPDYAKHLQEKEDKLRNAKNAVLEFANNVRAESSLPQNASKLLPLWNMIDLALGDANRRNKILETPLAQANAKRAEFDQKADEIGHHPLLNRRIPPGKYQLLVDFSRPATSNEKNDLKFQLLEFVIEDEIPKK